MGLRVRLDGERALFARPEFRHDLISYDLITPHAARGVLDAIYWRPGMTWVIDTIRVMHPIRRECVEHDGHRTLMLRDVRYLVEAHFELDADSPGESGRHAAMIKRALRSPPPVHLGQAGCAATVTPVDRHALADAAAPRGETVDYGWLLHTIDFSGDRRPRFFRAEATDGLVRVPAAGSPLMFG